ncbi:MAG: hypothetical protein QOI95_2883 [Acidimicrobiaceae bacterium]
MHDDDDGDDVPPDDDDRVEGPVPEGRFGIDPEVFRNLEAFSSLQRHIARLDLSAVRAMQQAASQALAPSAEMQQFADMQKELFADIGRSIDLSGVQNVFRDAQAAVGRAAVADMQKTWAETLANSTDMSALTAANDALLKSVDFAKLGETQQHIRDVIAARVDFSSIVRSLTQTINSESISDLSERIKRWLPPNLRDADLKTVAALTLDEGIPLSWVPRAEIVGELVAAQDGDERLQILGRLHEVLDDCRDVLSDIKCEWADQCRQAIDALALELDGPAQSHAGNIIDSIVLQLFGPRAREAAAQDAQANFAELPFDVASESLTLRPLYRAFAQWYPDRGVAPPDHFARHATAHAVGYRGLFGRAHALVAVHACHIDDAPVLGRPRLAAPPYNRDALPVSRSSIASYVGMLS